MSIRLLWLTLYLVAMYACLVVTLEGPPQLPLFGALFFALFLHRSIRAFKAFIAGELS